MLADGGGLGCRRMQFRNVRWVGIPTDRHREMVSLLRDTMGLAVNFEDETTVEFETSEGDEVQLHAPGDPYYEFFKQHATGPVPLFGRQCAFRSGLS
jgi:hypothetical protein